MTAHRDVTGHQDRRTGGWIVLEGARTNNLDDVSVRLPKGRLTVFTGLSGSGKSSLVFDTIAAEAQRQLNETFPAFLRHRLPKHERPDTEVMADLSATIVVDQKPVGGNSRSTVGTMTEIGSMLRVLFSRVGEPGAGEASAYSFNDPRGMCPECEGLGHVVGLDLSLLLDETRSPQGQGARRGREAGPRRPVPGVRRRAPQRRRAGPADPRSHHRRVVRHGDRGARRRARACGRPGGRPRRRGRPRRAAPGDRHRAGLPEPGPRDPDPARRRGPAPQDRPAPGQQPHEGDVAGLRRSDTVTGQWLRRTPELPEGTRPSTGKLAVRDADRHNLADLSLDLPEGVLTVVTGVAGSGKSTLATGVLVEQHPDAVVVDQTGIGISPRSTPATYVDAMDAIRDLFARANDTDPGLFSFNSRGACPECHGRGEIRTDLAYMDPVTVVCEGTRYDDEARAATLDGRSVVEVLDLTVDQALEAFDTARVHDRLALLAEVGLGYLRLGQPLSTLSGG